MRTGMPVCVDGEVARHGHGEPGRLTGEPLAVERGVGDNVFSGTAVEDGEIIVRVTADAGETSCAPSWLVEQAESFRQSSQRGQLADRIVPWNFLLAGAVAALTRPREDVGGLWWISPRPQAHRLHRRAGHGPKRAGGLHREGLRNFEAMAAADTIVFDKTDVDRATPSMACVLALDGGTVARCRGWPLAEEHFRTRWPAPWCARPRKNLRHRERHADVEYCGARHRVVARRQARGHRLGAFRRGGRRRVPTEEQKRRVADETEGCAAGTGGGRRADRRHRHRGP
ncbi:MAG: hypothetical protein ACLT98_08560 [Eggerthellaceae bacterium]